MSLFSTREWWVAQPGQQEEFASGCLVVDNLDNERDGGAEGEEEGGRER